MAVIDDELTRSRPATGGLFPYNDPRSKPGLYQTAGFGAAAPGASAALAAPRPPAPPPPRKVGTMSTHGGLWPYNDSRGQKSLYGAQALTQDAPPAAPMANAATKAPAPGEGAVFGMYPSLAGSLRTTYGMDNRLRAGVQVGANGSMQPVTPPIVGGGSGLRMDAATDPRSLLAGDPVEASTEIAKANVPVQAPSIAPGQYIGDEAVVDAKAPSDPKAVAASAPAAPGAGSVFQAGNSFGDSPESAAAMLARPAGMSAQNQAAFDTIGDRANAESVARVQAAGNKATYDQQVAEANAINERETRLKGSKEAVAALNAMQANQQNQARLGMDAQRVAQDGQRVAIQSAQAQLAAGREARDAARGAIDLRSAQRLDALQSTILDPKSTPEAKQSASAALLLAQGKSPDEYQIVHAAGGQTTDPKTGLPVKQPDRLVRYSKRTGQVEEIAAAPTVQASAPPPEAIKKLQSNPALAKDFDAKYGPGAAARALGKG